ncbi:magnesium transporter [Entomortierella parvispora]|uniref:Magnesium transporter n=1 Tax=Entomortierella parvispora TaxID=205924 RepID=A0A9P3H795_9FUNG|nr:magnesium transporter [Entomortierella parvispora]
MNPQRPGKDQNGVHSDPQPDQRNNNVDTVIAVDQTVPEAGAVLGQGSPLLSPAHLRMPDSNEPPAGPFHQVSLPQAPPADQQQPAYTFPAHGNSNNSAVESDDCNGNSNCCNGDSPQRPFSPPNVMPLSPPFRGDPASSFRYPSHIHHGTFTPSIRSEMPGQRPYESSIRNHEYHPPMGGHHHQARDSGRPMTIDYAGLDAAVTEATLIEHGFQKSAYLDTQLKEQGLDRAASTGSSGLLGPSSAYGNDFKRRSARKASFYSERAPRPPLPESLRYTFYSKSTGLIQAPTIPQILSGATVESDSGSRTPAVFSELLKDGCYWLDILDPSDFDMQIIAKYFHVHPLTIEDISTEEQREKYEVFRHYYFVCFRTFDQDYNSGSYLQPASMYSVVLRDGIITFHFRPTNHHLNVLRRMEQLQSHITLSSDWINYAILDDITDSFASPIQTIEYEVDSIDELVLLLRENETTDMLRRIGSCRKNVMAMSRLLANKADVVRGLMKRFDERYAIAPLASTSAAAATTTSTAAVAGAAPAKPDAQETDATKSKALIHTQHHRDGEILLYLGDILDHVLTMLQSLSSYEKILDRSHSNYLAQISLEINQLSNKTNAVMGTLTFFASLIVPMTFITGLWGMNVHVPGQPGQDPGEPLDWWWALIAAMVLYCIVAVIFGKKYGLI